MTDLIEVKERTVKVNSTSVTVVSAVRTLRLRMFDTPRLKAVMAALNRPTSATRASRWMRSRSSPMFWTNFCEIRYTTRMLSARITNARRMTIGVMVRRNAG